MSTLKRKPGYLATLDGWRAVAVVSVIAYHDRVHQYGRASDAPLHQFGYLGVSLFFAISGLLICSRLLDEERVKGHISIRNFYVRRAFRILPPALLFLATVALLGMFHVIRVHGMAWTAALLFFSNYYTAVMQNSGLSLYTNHFWSLSVEEHFYLILPFLLVYFRRHRFLLLSTLSVLSLAYSLIEQSIPAFYKSMGAEAGDVRTEVIIVRLFFPALLALLLTLPVFRLQCVRWVTPVRVFFCLGLLWALMHRFVPSLTLKTLVPLGFPFVILSTVLHPDSYLGRVLETRPLRFLGGISYSLYLWQQLFFIGGHEAATGILGIFQRWPVNVAATFLCAIGSYYLVEIPFIRLGSRLAPSATAGRPHFVAEESAPIVVSS